VWSHSSWTPNPSKSSPCTLEELRRNSTLVNAIRLIPAIFWVAILAPRSLRPFLACKPSMPIPRLPTHLPIHSFTMQRSLTSTVFIDLGRYSHAPILLENFEPLQKKTPPLLSLYLQTISGIYRSGSTLSNSHFLKRLGDGSCHNYSLHRQPQLWYQEFPHGFFLGSILTTSFIVWSAGIH
jgi:hypothetical protein